MASNAETQGKMTYNKGPVDKIPGHSVLMV